MAVQVGLEELEEPAALVEKAEMVGLEAKRALEI